MNHSLPDYLRVEADALSQGSGVGVRIVEDAAALSRIMADEMFQCLASAAREGRHCTMIVPVGPVDQFPLLAERINNEGLDCRDALFINMDEYLTDDDRWIAEDHPLCFRGYMRRAFYDRIDSSLATRVENRVFPDPERPDAIGRLIAERGGVDVCFGGIGINGHIAFNEPPEPDQTMTPGDFAALSTRVLTLARETRTINSVTVGGDISVVPRRAVTVGMREILAARALRFYCNRPWQSGVVRRVLHGPVAADCPASLLRTHADATMTITRQVAERPEIRLR